MPEKMTLAAYLAQRGVKAKALKRGEAEAFGIPYPLQAGWPWRYGAMEITPAMIEDAQARVRRTKVEARVKMRSHSVQVEQGSLALTEKPAPQLAQFPGFVLRQARRHRSRSSAPW